MPSRDVVEKVTILASYATAHALAHPGEVTSVIPSVGGTQIVKPLTGSVEEYELLLPHGGRKSVRGRELAAATLQAYWMKDLAEIEGSDTFRYARLVEAINQASTNAARDIGLPSTSLSSYVSRSSSKSRSTHWLSTWAWTLGWLFAIGPVLFTIFYGVVYLVLAAVQFGTPGLAGAVCCSPPRVTVPDSIMQPAAILIWFGGTLFVFIRGVVTLPPKAN
jgi:hypothetical protein